MKRRRMTVLLLVVLAIGLVAACGKMNEAPAADESSLQGKITAIQGKRVLLIDRSNVTEESPNPRAVWIDFAGVDVGELKIGTEIRAWTDGVMLESYPEQTKGTRYEVTNADMGKGDLHGTVTGLKLDGPEEERSIEIDGQSYIVVPFAAYWLEDKKTEASSLKVGDVVEVWFPGYQVMDEKPVTQVKILSQK